MFESGEGIFQYFIITGGETHLVESRPHDNPVENEDFFLDTLNTQFRRTPTWEAVGAFCYTEYREDKNTSTTYISSEIMYDWKKPIYSAAKKLAVDEYADTFHETVELPGSYFPNFEGFQTFSRGPDALWDRQPVPVKRAIFASRNASDNEPGSSHRHLGHIDGYDVWADHLDRPYVEMEPASDRFVYFCHPSQESSVETDGVIPVKNDSLWTPSVLWGGDFSHKNDESTAIVFQTSQAPTFAHPDKGAMWRDDIDVEDYAMTDSDVSSHLRPLSPLPSSEKMADQSDCDPDQSPYVKYRSRQKQARLPLGEPGGPCHIIHNIEDTRLPDTVKEDLKEDIWQEGELDKSDEEFVYRDHVKINLDQHPVFSEVSLTHHAQHRMDLRGIDRDDIKSAFDEFGRWFSYRKRNPNEMGRDDEEKLNKLQRGKGIRFHANRIGITVVFSMESNREAVLITVFDDDPDPRPPSPGECVSSIEKQSSVRRVSSWYARRLN